MSVKSKTKLTRSRWSQWQRHCVSLVMFLANIFMKTTNFANTSLSVRVHTGPKVEFLEQKGGWNLVTMSLKRGSAHDSHTLFTFCPAVYVYLRFSKRTLVFSHYFKGSVSWEFQPLCFFPQKTLPGQHISRLKRFCKVFCFLKDIWLQSSKFACPYSQWLCKHRILALGEGVPYLNYC